MPVAAASYLLCLEEVGLVGAVAVVDERPAAVIAGAVASY